ncbi:CBL-interacting serine/threonine-protein kinase 6-like [Senna tora]|uniref:CBL-interacting serine/threonine-protein kinase 6-like n=1 Tax=Senna tora TaxID=362788 RepID=A0A834W4M6_9FABA|nr:CBL-interacting serine/threonine-protein kinase 6-like [Senna tora]
MFIPLYSTGSMSSVALGHGMFAKVYQAKNLLSGKSMALKVVGKEKVIRSG